MESFRQLIRQISHIINLIYRRFKPVSTTPFYDMNTCSQTLEQPPAKALSAKQQAKRDRQKQTKKLTKIQKKYRPKKPLKDTYDPESEINLHTLVMMGMKKARQNVSDSPMSDSNYKSTIHPALSAEHRELPYAGIFKGQWSNDKVGQVFITKIGRKAAIQQELPAVETEQQRQQRATESIIQMLMEQGLTREQAEARLNVW